MGLVVDPGTAQGGRLAAAQKRRRSTEVEEGAKPLKRPQGDTGPGMTPTDRGLPPTEYRAMKQIAAVSRAEGAALPDPVQSLDQAPFGKRLRKPLLAAGFMEPTPIQAQGWPVMMAGTDLVAVAKTGSGKTLAFLLPILRHLAKSPPQPASPVEALVLAPTRELALQIHTAAAKFGSGAGCLCVYGGVPKGGQVQALQQERPSLLVATPGRLIDLLDDGAVRLGAIRFLVLDEADRMLDMGFEEAMRRIMADVPAARQTALFTATWPKAVRRLADTYLRPDHVHINVGETEDLAANKAVTQQFFELDDSEKDGKLWELLSAMQETDKVIVFANTKRRIDNMEKMVWSCGWSCVAMHGNKTQGERDKGLAQFVAGTAPILLATDVCARGLDINGVSHVINFDMARDVESYVHRIGRTGRGGASGASITFFNAAYDVDCAPALMKIALEAGQPVPPFLEKAAGRAGKGKNKQWRY
uniref:Probable eukaryotic initiation factor 4A n=1 Tax=Eutreptiella gymnastica TaxID=73025 RepID=A0A7S1J4G4_9EUGL|mmetsp:Transcript_66441/g.117974  ORF Transcript_66441/g.117974 Transcript_66441/m.117974 type:complete len:473 (+) Transcript_66441:25-1443(+)